ncbi:MAG: 6-pyruvoyl trahydropterin synthase family protein [Butyrivibrio sp.]
MYYLKTEQSFDSAHFLADYEGKCRNIHGHEWRVVIEVVRESLDKEGQTRDMMFDFGQLKKDLKKETDALDHCLIIEKGSLRPNTVNALREERFNIVEFPFRPTAERLARYFYERISSYGYMVHSATVYETPQNCAVYEGEGVQNVSRI